MALSRTDWLIAGYLAFTTAVIVWRGPFSDGRPWLLVSHAGFVLLLVLVARVGHESRLGRTLRTFYPILLLPGLYAEIGVLNDARGLTGILEHDAIVQGWEGVFFGGQVSFTWIRAAPNALLSGFFHFVYLLYYPILVFGAPYLAARGNWDGARDTVFAMMTAFVACYVVFILFPVAGPNYAFSHPTGPAREVWTAKLVYGTLAGGSSVGAAFPSSHVAATVAVTLAAGRARRTLGWVLAGPTVLLLVAVVYCQMHYAVDAAAGLLVGLAAAFSARPRSGLRAGGRPSALNRSA